MHITRLEEYGLRCALQLARGHACDPDRAMRSSEIAAAESLSMQYVSKIMHLFRKAKLIGAVRGHQGGFYLNLSPDQLSIKNVLDALSSDKEKAQQDNFCELFTGKNQTCVHLCDCSLRPIWSHFFNYFYNVLGKITLADLAKKEKHTQELIHKLAGEETKKLLEQLK